MSEFHIQNCPVCDAEEFSPYLTTADFFISGEVFNIIHCNGCGMKITAGAKDEDQIGSYYQSEDYVSHSNTGKGFVNFLYHMVRSYMLGRKRKLATKVSGKKTGHILDVGAGTGYFLNEMKQHKWQVTGTEKSPDARNFAASRFNLDLLPAEELFGLKEQSFEVITLWHVLEHVHRLNDYMDVFYRLLKPDGKLVIAVPNRNSFDARYYKRYWAAWDVPRHLWHFAPKNMKLLAAKHGFKVSRMANMPFDSFYVSILSEKYRNAGLALLKGLIIGKLSWLISLTRKGRASSVIYVIEKNL